MAPKNSRERFPRDSTHLIREAVRVPAILFGGETVRASIALLLLRHENVPRPFHPEVDVQMTSTADLVGYSHL